MIITIKDKIAGIDHAERRCSIVISKSNPIDELFERQEELQRRLNTMITVDKQYVYAKEEINLINKILC